MDIVNIERRASAAPASRTLGGLRNADNVTRVRRPYTAFERGGIHRFSPGTGPKLFRVT
jgi:hypothetical protein